MGTVVDPYDHRWVQRSLVARAERVAAGVDPDEQRRALFDELWPWAVASAERAARRLPAHADRNELRSRILVAVWETTNRIDWERPLAWPSLLKRRVDGARLDAARADNVLSRRDRQAYHRALRAIASREQALGRQLTHAEQEEIAAPCFGDRTGLFTRVRELTQASPIDPAAPTDVPAPANDGDPAERAVAHVQHEALQRWLAESLPQPVAAQVVSWARRDRAGAALPRRLARRVDPYVPALASVIDASGANR